MTWLDPISLNPIPGKWILSSVIENDFVKINHQTSGLNNSFFTGTIAQAEIDDNQELILYDLREVKTNEDYQAFYFPKPDCFTDRRIAFNANPYALLVSGQIWDWSLSISEFSTVASLPNFVTGMKLWLDGTGFQDKSGNNNNATAIGSAPSQAVGLDNQPVLRWNGSASQELQIAQFLANTSSATLYIVCTINSTNNYNLIRTANIDDYWRFSDSGSGYFGTFRNSRFENYPASMPSSGSHLISIHCGNGNYEVIVDKVSKGQVSSVYNPGDRFRIATNDKAFIGDIGTILVYPSLISPSSPEHAQNLAALKALYPSLPFTL